MPDMNTIMIGFVLSIGLQLVVVISLWRQHGNRYQGLNIWVLAYFFVFTGFLSIVLFDLPTLSGSIITIDIFSLIGLITLLFGLERFFDKNLSWKINLSILFIAGANIIHFTFLGPGPGGGLTTIALAVGIVWIQYVWLIFKRINPEFRNIGNQVGFMALLLALVTLFRVFVDFNTSSGLDGFDPSVLSTWSFFISQLLFFGFTLFLILMVCSRLSADLEIDLQERSRAEMALGKSEGRYKRLVEGAPAVVYSFSDKRGGLYYSKGVEKILGFPVSTLIENPYLWANSIHPDHKEEINKAVLDFSKGKNFDVKYRIKDSQGKWRWFRDLSIGRSAHGAETIIEGIAFDITLTVQSEELIKEKEMLYRALFEKNHSVMLLIDPKTGQIVNANPAACSYYGYSNDELVNMKISDINTLPQVEIHKEMERAKSVKRNYFNFSHRLADGSTRDVEVFSGPLELGGKELLCSIIHDVTQRKQAEDAVKESEQQLNSVINTMRDGLAVTNSNGIIQFVNAAFCAMYQYAADELIGMHAAELVHSDYQDEFDRFLTSLGETGQFSGETVDIKKDGTLFNAENVGSRIVYKGQDCFLAVVRDVTDRKKVEEALQKSERNMSTVLSNTLIGVVRLDTNLRHIFANPAIYHASGFTPEEYLGKTNEEIGLPEDLSSLLRENHGNVLKTGETKVFEFEFSTTDKGQRNFQAVATPEFNENKRVESIVSFIRDITELKQAEAAKDAAIKRLEQALSEVKTLRGLIPICASCKKIRDDKGYWNQIETYIEQRSEALFSHGICQECAEDLYKDTKWFQKQMKKKEDTDEPV